MTDPPPPGTVTYAGHRHPRPDHGAVVDGVSQGHVDERPERADVADGGEPGQHGGPGVADPAERLLGGAAADRRDPGPLNLADQVGVAVDQPRQQRVPGQVDDPGPLGRRLARAEHPLDPFPAHQQSPSLEDLAGLHVDQPGPPDHQPPVVRHRASSRLARLAT